MEFVGPLDTAPSASAVTSPVEAVHDLYERHYRRLVCLATMLLGDVGRAEEIVQDAFVDLLARWERIRDPESAVSYLRMSVANGPGRICVICESSGATWPRSPSTSTAQRSMLSSTSSTSGS
jgi:hypothetical protein